MLVVVVFDGAELACLFDRICSAPVGCVVAIGGEGFSRDAEALYPSLSIL
jgi:hypothetical protein